MRRADGEDPGGAEVQKHQLIELELSEHRQSRSGAGEALLLI